MCCRSVTSVSCAPSNGHTGCASRPRRSGSCVSENRGAPTDRWPAGICGPVSTTRMRKSDAMQTRVSTRLMLAAALAVAGLTTSSAQTRPAATATAASAPRIAVEKYTLPNGLEVLLSPDRELPTVAVNIWYHVGPVNEAANRTGFAHLFEHMMFQCSKHVPCDQHLALVQAAGGDVNGTTSFDRTNYYETLPSNQLELALWLESD